MNDESPYESVQISDDEASEMRETEGTWDWITENHHGTVHWNNMTGELMWCPSDSEELVSYTKLKRKA